MILYEETKCCFVKSQLQSPKFAAAMNHSQLPRNFPSGSAPCSLAYQAPASSTFLSEQTSHQQPASSTFLSEQISMSHVISQTNMLLVDAFVEGNVNQRNDKN
jgi:hypothetical protein